jgi:glycosyltransferase involved in cell wall biosynthesis
MAAALTRLLADDELRARLGAAGRSRFLDRFEAGGWATRLRALYDGVLADTERRPRRPSTR